MRKRLAITAIAVAACLVLLVSGVACAWFTDTATARVTLKTGYVKITTCNVTLAKNFQPGDTQYKKIWIYNKGPCPFKVDRITIRGLSGMIDAKVTPSVSGKVSPGRGASFTLFVKMYPGVGDWAAKKTFHFQIEFHVTNLPTAH